MFKKFQKSAFTRNLILSFFVILGWQAHSQSHSAEMQPQQIQPLFASVMASPMSVYFGTVYMNSFNSRMISVTNTGDETLRAGVGFASGSGFSGSNGCYGDLAPHQTCYVTIYYQPFMSGYSYGSYSLSFTSATGFASASINVSLSAQAIDYPR